MRATEIFVLAGIGIAAYLLLKPKNKPTETPAPQKPDCSAYGKVNCQIIDDLGHSKEWCCCPEGQVLCGQGKDTPDGGPPPSIETKCYDPNVDYVMNPCA